MIASHKFYFYMVFQLVFFTGCSQVNKTEEQTKKDSSQLNRLIHASSPYLQQHANNPVDWYEWGEEALQKAKKENKPLLISIGYSACHWCHVMERESFMDSSVAKIMNENFISIKIDREERPDIDQIYMDASQILTGRRGWPLNAFALPDGRPFFAGTYYPKEQWKNLLKEISNLYNSKHEIIVKQANKLTQGIKSQDVIIGAEKSDVQLSKTGYENIFEPWKKMLDLRKGGFGGEPKFPLPISWEFLLQYHYLTDSKLALEAVTVTLDEMAKGGIYDQIGGGFARYAIDSNWFAPHFEKMLYDNGQLVSLYAHAYKLTKNKNYFQVIRETLEFISREMTSPEGGFYSSLNADSEGEEGQFYVWTVAEVEKVLDKETVKLIKDYYQVKKSGNWEPNKNILHRKLSITEFAKKNNLSVNDWEAKLNVAKQKLFEERETRIRPSTDNKILTSWNSLMMKGYVDAYLALGDRDYLEVALKNAHFIETNMIREDGSLLRNYKDGKANINAFLDDYAHLAEAYIHLYQATFDVHWLNLAKKLTDYAIEHFMNEKQNMFYYTSDLSENLIARKMEIADNVIPSSNSVMANVLLKLGEYFYHKPYTTISRTMLNQVSNDSQQNGPYYSNWAILMGYVAYELYEVAITGDNAYGKNLQMQQNYLPTTMFMGGTEENLPLLENKVVEGETTIFVCQQKSCKIPVTEVEKALLMIDN